MWWLAVAIGAILLVTMAVVFRGAPYVPTRRRDLEQAFSDLYAIGPSDALVDIGSGDGIVLRMAARRGARAIGVEINPFLAWLSRWLSRREQLVSVVVADMWRYDLPTDATVVYVFGTGRDLERIAEWMELQVVRRSKPLYVISYGFQLPWPILRSAGAHYLYELMPLQGDKAQV